MGFVVCIATRKGVVFMKKRILSLLLAMVMVIGLFPITVHAEPLDSGLVYEIHKDHVEITGYTGDATEIVIPTEIEGLPVTSISDSAFYGCTSLTSINIPDSVSMIGRFAFKDCTSLTNIGIMDSVLEIGSCAFYGCSNLSSITIPDSVISIGDSVFCGCTDLISIELPNSVASISGGIFSGCTSLTSIDLPDGVTSIGNWAFSGCTSLTNIDLPISVTFIGDYAFNNCTSLTSIELPTGVTSIGYRTFYNCTSLTNIDFPDRVTSIGEQVFYGCTSLTRIDVPDSVTAIGVEAFARCTNLSSVCFKCDAPEFGENVFRKVTTNAYYPADNSTWSDDVMQNYGGRITWIPYDPNHTHEYEVVIIAPTCTEQGFTTYTCSCGDTYVSDKVPALGHTEETIPAVAATCIETGLTEGKKCSVCGEVLVAQETVSALGHDWKGTSCQRCDATRENPFADVVDGSFYINPVLWAVENGITSGTSKTTFDPSGLCLRAHVVTFLYRAAGSPVPSSNKNPFTDVKSGDFYYNPVLWAVENGITQGISKNQFGSTQVCNRAAVVTFLWRAFGSPEPKSTNNPFVDVKNTDFFYKPVLWAVENGITAGIDATHFNPAGACNRAQVVTFLYRAYN